MKEETVISALKVIAAIICTALFLVSCYFCASAGIAPNYKTYIIWKAMDVQKTD